MMAESAEATSVTRRRIGAVIGCVALSLGAFVGAAVRLDPGAGYGGDARSRLVADLGARLGGGADEERGPGFATKELDLSGAASGVAATTHPAGSDLVAHSGGDASQTGKHTWAASDPEAIAAFWLDVLPTTAWMVGNYSVDGGCATYGKVFVGNDSSTGVHGVNAPFQLHAVRAYARSSGALSMRALEAKFGDALTRWGFDGQAARADAAAGGPVAVLESITGRRPAWDIFKPLYLAQIELVFHDS